MARLPNDAASLDKFAGNNKIATPGALRVGFGFAWRTEASNKGLKLVHQVLRRLSNSPISQTNYQFVFFGRAKPPSNIRTSQNLTLSSVGWIDHAEMPEFLSSLDLLLFPSRNDSYGLLVEEALQANVPTLVSRFTGARDLIQNEDQGFVIEDLHPDSWLSALHSFSSRLPTQFEDRSETDSQQSLELVRKQWIDLLVSVGSSRGN
jgi:glycosyltransferase involved in cell wall biosynthesis